VWLYSLAGGAEFAGAPKLEMFAPHRDGWDVWGNEAQNDPHCHHDLPLQRPPRKRKPVALDMPAVVVAKSSRRTSPVGGKGEAAAKDRGTARHHNGSARSIKHAARGSTSYFSAASLRLACQR
jgi:hypothetical protein